MNEPRAITERAIRPKCDRAECAAAALPGSSFCSRLCERLHWSAIESTDAREEVETGELISGHAHLDGVSRRPNLQNSA